MWGLLVMSPMGLLFGLVTFMQLRNLPVHRSMLEISELIYETCRNAYLITQGKFLLVLWVFIAVIISAYFWLAGACAGQIGGSDASHHLAFQFDWHCGQLWRGLVRYPGEHLCQLCRARRSPV